MAITNADGSIVLSTKVDTNGVKKGMNSLRDVTSKMAGLMSVAFSTKLVANFAKETKELYKVQMQNEVKLATVMRQRINATDEQIKKILDLTSAEQKKGIIGDEVQIAGLQQLATFAKQQETIETLLPAMNNLIAQQNGYEASTGSAVNVANLMGKVLQGQTGALTRVGITFDETQEKVLKYGNETERAAMLAKVITENVGEMNSALAQTDIGRQMQLANTMGDIKEQFGEAVTQIQVFFLPALKALAQVLTQVAVIFKTATNSFFGGGKEQKAEWQNIASSTGQTAQNIDDQTDAQKALNKEVKKSLAGFDELNTLSQDTESGSGSGDVSTVGGNLGIGDLGSNFGGDSIVTAIDETMAKIMQIAGFALVAIGIILLCFGQIGWGIGFIIAGAAAFTVARAALKSNEATKKSQETMDKIIAIASIALLALGIVLVCFGVVSPLSIGMIIAGAVGLVAEVALNWNAITNAVTKFFQKNAGIIAGVSTALLVLGVILLLTGVGTPLGIGLILAGSAGLAAVVALNWNFIVDKVKEIWNKIKEFWNKYIAPIFTAKWWEDLGKKALNGLIGIFEKGINYIINKINTFVRGIDSVVGAVGSIFGADWSVAQIPKVSIPRLAQGAVIPPNREFMAVLGDQKHGTNIEAPLDTIKQGVAEVLANMNVGSGFNGRIEVPLYLNGRQIALAVREAENNLGTQTVFGGFANAY